MTEAAITAIDIVKRYQNMPINAVDGVSFEVSKGEVFGLLGPNGAGKTTTVGILTTLARATSGTGRVGGVDVVADPVGARSKLAMVPQRSNLDRSISIRQNLLFHAAYHSIPAGEREERAEAVLTQFGLIERANDKPDFFSGGQAQRVMIARALMHEPEVLFLDEPTTGLDPAARLFVWDRLKELAERGVTLFLTTHDMDEAAALSDRVGIMDHGKLLALDTPAALTRGLPGSTTLELTVDRSPENADRLIESLNALDEVERVESVSSDSQWRVRLYLTGEAPLLVAPATAVLTNHDLTPTDIRLGIPSLEDVFIHLTGRTLR
ncbi:MAG: type transport system ATP-binding protein [Actinomycetota bacterium]|nr:type transport system ATP-binding protein [Actinomycetota bacterium]